MAEFVEEWFGAQSQIALANLASNIADVDGMIVEIGSWEGRSTIVLADAVAPRTVHAVDTWEGSPSEVSAAIAASRDVYATFLSNTTGMNIVAHKMGWREYIPTITVPVAFAFIDAEHSYREVFDNVQALAPLMASGGILCGDDSHHPPVRQAVLELLPAADVYVQATVWSWRKP